MKSELYSKHALQYDLAVQDNIYNAYLERPSLQALIGDSKGLDVIDLGCGSGIYAEYFVAQGAKSVTCIDISEQMIEIVRSKLGNNVKAYAQDLSIGLPQQASESADIIACPLVLHYIQDLSIIFKEANRVLKPGGVMVFSTHHPFADFQSSISGDYFKSELIKQQWDTVGEPVSVSFYRRSLSEISDAITSNGLLIVQISEGHVSEQAKAISEETYQHLNSKPNFIFIKCQKLA
ncbi:MAG: class I SAM-dependent methyltransferase [Psychromonas sp.]